MNVRLIFLLGAMLFGVAACTQVPQWTLFYVADQDQMPEGALAPHIAGYYEELEQCLAKGAGMVKLSQSGKGSYQCGFECKDQAGDVQCSRFERVPAL